MLNSINEPFLICFFSQNCRSLSFRCPVVPIVSPSELPLSRKISSKIGYRGDAIIDPKTLYGCSPSLLLYRI